MRAAFGSTFSGEDATRLRVARQPLGCGPKGLFRKPSGRKHSRSERKPARVGPALARKPSTSLTPAHGWQSRDRFGGAFSFIGTFTHSKGSCEYHCEVRLDDTWSDAYRFAMIKSFRNKGLEAFATTGDTRKLPVRGAAARKLARQLAVLNAAIKPEDMNLPGFYFHGLRGEQRYSVRVTANYRLTYGWNDKDAIDVDLEDYH